MKSNMSRTILVLIICSVSSMASAFDRVAEHSRQMAGLGLIERETAEIRASSPTMAASTDYLISNSSAPAHFTQDNSDVAQLKSGQWLVSWSDNRLGAEKIFFQRHSSAGALADTNTLIAGSLVGANLSDPLILPDTLGRFYLLYRNTTTGLIVGTRWTDALAPILSEFQVNDSSLGAYAGPFDAAIYPDGRLVVVWENYSAGGNTITMRVYNAAGGSVLGPVTAHSDASPTNRWTPSVAVDPQSGFVVGWEDYRLGNADIYARLFNGAGLAVGPDFGVVSPIATDSQQYTPEVIFSPRDQYAIGWIDSRAGQEVYLQAYDATTGLVGGNTIISVADPSAINWNLHFAVNQSGDLLASWDATVSQSSILARRFTNGFAPVALPSAVNASSTGQRWNPGASFSAAGAYAVCWSEFQNQHSDIAFQLFNSSGTAQLSELTLNDDPHGAPKSEPVILATSDWFNLIAFTSTSADQGDIIASCISNGNVIQVSNTKVNQDVSGALQSEPSLGHSATQGLFVWNDSRDVLGIPGQRIYGRFCSLFGAFSASEFMVSDSNQTGLKASPKVAMTPAGKGLVAWIDLRGASPQIWGRWLTAGGALDGPEVQISQAGTDSSCTDLNAGVDLAGRFYITWVDRRATPVVRGHWYNANGTSGGYIDYTPPGALIDELVTAINDSGEVTIAYTGNASGLNAFAAAVNRGSVELFAPAQINDDNSANPTEPDISFSVSTDQYAMTWVDRRSGKRSIECQMLDANWLSVGANQEVSSGASEYMINPSVTLNDGRAWFAWADPRQYGQNIWSTVIVYEPTGIDDPHGLVPSKFTLHQNYPNPFNPSTEIRFSLTTRGVATLEVFNVLGERVVVLAEGVFPSGEQRIVWNGMSQSGRTVSSGIYLYRLTTSDGSFSRKMVLLK
jgi:hypothetical protein